MKLHNDLDIFFRSSISSFFFHSILIFRSSLFLRIFLKYPVSIHKPWKSTKTALLVLWPFGINMICLCSVLSVDHRFAFISLWSIMALVIFTRFMHFTIFYFLWEEYDHHNLCNVHSKFQNVKCLFCSAFYVRHWQHIQSWLVSPAFGMEQSKGSQWSPACVWHETVSSGWIRTGEPRWFWHSYLQ